MNKHAAYIILSIIIILLTGCNDNHRMDTVERFLNEDKLDSAETELGKIESATLKGDAMNARYNLLKTTIQCRTDKLPENDSLIDFSINYYTAQNNTDKIADCYYYKGTMKYGRDVAEAFLLMKKAENLSKNSNNKKLKHKIIERLADWNIFAGQYELGLKYAEENLEISKQAGDKNWLAYAYTFIAIAHDGLGHKDIARKNMTMAMKHIEKVPVNERAEFFSIMGTCYINIGRKDEAMRFYSKSLSINKTADAYYGMGIILHERKKHKEAEESFTNAKKLCTPDQKIQILDTQHRLFSQDKQTDKAYDICKEEIKYIQELDSARRINDLIKVQAQYDDKIISLRLHKTLLNLVLTVVIFILLFAIILLYNRYKKNNIKKHLYENQLLLNTYRERVSSINSLSKEQGKEVDKLKKKIKELEQKQSEILYNGKMLYEEIANGGTIVKWNKKDYSNFLEYYKFLDQPFMEQIEQNYKSMSPRYQLAMVLHHMEKSDQEIMEIMAISQGTIRTIKHRIKEKRRTDNPSV